ncbi:MAG: hypothetical protein F6J86_35220 [Symploca sp. SIO1B1]|nr:hypothetical protein [Symploca sp. SIO1C2]NER52735.1 hypothetical protein [Symploca sp. SIO1A3]NER99018.1 hypothetical protein [Symploca sp. SIO1B1]
MTLSPAKTIVVTKGKTYRIANPIAELAIQNIITLFTEPDTSQKSGSAEIEKLVKSLAQLPGVEEVKAISHQPDDLHEVTFEILSHLESPERRELAAKAMILVRETEWMLCETTNEDNWDFGTQMLRRFPTFLNANQVIASSYAQRECLQAAS